MRISNIRLYESIRILLNGGLYKHVIARELKPQISETILDVGCGTGIYSTIVTGKYIGVDINPHLIEYANHTYAGHNKVFYANDVQSLIKQKKIKQVNKAIIINVLHHLNDQKATSLLKCIKTITKKKVIIVDTDKEGANWLQRLFYMLDDGHHIRSQKELRHLIGKHFQIRNELPFFPLTHTVRLCLFDCIPHK